MCTILVLNQVHPRWPLVVAANRDEELGRLASGPQVLGTARDGARILGGRDERRAGTWMGVTEAGFFVGLTNQRPATRPAPAPRSRGEVVLAALEAGEIGAVEALLATLRPADYGGFNLLYGSAGGLRLARFRPDLAGADFADVPPGRHVLPNDRLDAPDVPKVDRARAALDALPVSGWPDLAAGLRAILADHRQAPLERFAAEDHAFLPAEVRQALDAVCIHLPGYGTRSAMLLALAPGEVAHADYADGKPCTTPFTDFRALAAGHGI